MPHRYVTDQGEAVGRAIEVQAWRQTHRSVVIGIGVHVRVGPRQRVRGRCSERSEGLVWSGLPGGFRARRWCWSCPAGVTSRDGTAGLDRTVWSTTTNRKGRSVERQLECRGRLVWRTRRPSTSGWALTLGRARILRSAGRRSRCLIGFSLSFPPGRAGPRMDETWVSFLGGKRAEARASAQPSR